MATPRAPVFDLHVAATENERALDLRLCDAEGRTLATNVTRLSEHPASRFEGLFDLRRYVERYAGHLHPLHAEQPLTDHELLAELSVFLGRTVLGHALLDALGAHAQPRTLRVRLPEAPNDLGAALARVPWEFARRDERDSILAAKNVRVQAWPGDARVAPAPPPLDPREPLRVLLVFAAARGTPPLAARLERRCLLDVFHKRVYPHGRLRVDVLIHGVTRGRLERQIERAGGYHVVHWSGHGQVDRLALEPDPEAPGETSISGRALAQLFADAGQAPPHLVFLGACRSGDAGSATDWSGFEATLEATRSRAERRRRQAPPEELEAQLQRRPGYTGAAQALIAAGVPSVVAMRFEVGDEYARTLALEFYARLLGQGRPTAAGEALNQARRAVQRRDSDAEAFDACDHAAPLLYGQDDPGLALSGTATPVPSLHPLPRVEALRPHAHFVGRTWELARLAAGWLDDGQRPLALIRGLGGLGKTALAAEAIDVWHERFRYVFPLDCRGGLTVDEFLRHLHAAWLALPSHYAERVTRFPDEALWRPASERFSGAERTAALLLSLREALRLEAVLIVLDNFESNLTAPSAPGSDWACRDPAWEQLLGALPEALRDGASRLLVTTRHPPRDCLASARVQDVLLGPLPPDEAALYVGTHDLLRRAWFERGEPGRAHVRRLLDVSRGHPLLLDRLARLEAFDLERAVARVRQHGLATLPGFLAGDPAQAEERAYLEGALASSIDLLLERAGPQARHALWVLSLAREPQTAALWRAVTQRELPPGIDLGWAEAPALEPGQRRTRRPSPSRKDTRRSARARGVPTAQVAEWRALVASLVDCGLVQSHGHNAVSAYDCHESVRSRVAVWRQAHPDESKDESGETVWGRYAALYAGAFRHLRAQSRLDDALHAGRRALAYATLGQRLDTFQEVAGSLLASTHDPALLRALVPDLERAAANAPPGERAWSAQLHLADALRAGERAAESLHSYQLAAAQAEAAGAWADVATICGNWGHALRRAGQLEGARAKHHESARLKRASGASAVSAAASEVEAWRIDVMLGHWPDVLRDVGPRVDELRAVWSGRSGLGADEADDARRALLGALDVHHQAYLAAERWADSLACLDEMLAVQQQHGASPYELAVIRFNRYGALLRLERPGEARHELEACLPAFAGGRDDTMLGRSLAALAHLFHDEGDYGQAAALERRALHLRNGQSDPVERAVSHSNLGFYLHCLELWEEAAGHEAAALLYRIVLSHRQHLDISEYNHRTRLTAARRAGRAWELPGIERLLAQPEFGVLAAWLNSRGVDLVDLAGAVAAFVDGCKARVPRSASDAAAGP